MSRVFGGLVAVASLASCAVAGTLDFQSLTTGMSLNGEIAGTGLSITGAEVVDAGARALDDIVGYGKFAIAEIRNPLDPLASTRIDVAALASTVMRVSSLTVFLDDADGSDGGTGLLGAEIVTVEVTYSDLTTDSLVLDSVNFPPVGQADINVRDDVYQLNMTALFGDRDLLSFSVYDSGRRFGIDNVVYEVQAVQAAVPMPAAASLAVAGLAGLGSRRRR